MGNRKFLTGLILGVAGAYALRSYLKSDGTVDGTAQQIRQDAHKDAQSALSFFRQVAESLQGRLSRWAQNDPMKKIEKTVRNVRELARHTPPNNKDPHLKPN